MLRACHRVLRPGGSTAFAVIALTDGLEGDEAAAGIEAGPPFVDAGPGYSTLMAAAGFVDVAIADVTDEYHRTAQAWLCTALPCTD